MGVGGRIGLFREEAPLVDAEGFNPDREAAKGGSEFMREKQAVVPGSSV